MGNTVLHFACFKDITISKVEQVQILISKNANINIQNNNGHTPLHFACASEHIDVIPILLLNNADYKIKTNDNITAIDLAIQSNNLDIINIFNSYKNYNDLNQSIISSNNNKKVIKYKL